jgi:hypothetical protein
MKESDLYEHGTEQNSGYIKDEESHGENHKYMGASGRIHHVMLDTQKFSVQKKEITFREQSYREKRQYTHPMGSYREKK